MTLDTITREEFDRRLEQSTARMRQHRLSLEAQTVELEDLIGRYESVIERLKVESEQGANPSIQQRNDLCTILTELAERTSAVMVAL